MIWIGIGAGLRKNQRTTHRLHHPHLVVHGEAQAALHPVVHLLIAEVIHHPIPVAGEVTVPVTVFKGVYNMFSANDFLKDKILPYPFQQMVFQDKGAKALYLAYCESLPMLLNDRRKQNSAAQTMRSYLEKNLNKIAKDIFLISAVSRIVLDKADQKSVRNANKTVKQSLEQFNELALWIKSHQKNIRKNHIPSSLIYAGIKRPEDNWPTLYAEFCSAMFHANTALNLCIILWLYGCIDSDVRDAKVNDIEDNLVILSCHISKQARILQRLVNARLKSPDAINEDTIKALRSY